MLFQSLRALTGLNVAQEDYKLDNYRLVGDKIMVIDFGKACTMEREDPDFVAMIGVNIFRGCTKFSIVISNGAHLIGAFVLDIQRLCY